MPAILPPSSLIGTLLRKLEESASEKPTSTMATDNPSAPIRETVQAPLETPIAPESPGTERVMSLKPEGSVQASVEATPESITPSTSKVGGIGGPEGGMIPALPTQAQAPQPQPSLEEYLSKGKTAAQWYAETGRQSELDRIGKEASSGGVGNIDEFMKSGKIANDKWAVNPESGELYEAPRPVSEPNTATLQQYLDQGKTVEQWYAETGRQSDLDKLTKGATQAVPRQAYTQGGALPPGEKGPPPQATLPMRAPGQVLGMQSLTPSGAEPVYGPQRPPDWNKPIVTETGEVLPPAGYLPPEVLTPLESVPSYAAEPTPTPPAGMAGQFIKAINESKTEEEANSRIEELIGQMSPGTLSRLRALLTPTPKPGR